MSTVRQIATKREVGVSGVPRRIFKPGDTCKGGRYKIFDLLGAGGMCEVWRAYDEEEMQWAAVKVLKSKLAFDDESKRRLEKEAETLLDLNHKHLVKVFHADVDEERNIFFYVMELLEGETLDEKIHRMGELPLVDALRIVAEVANAVHAVHVLGIVHRDLKPENTFVDKHGRTVLLDFGVAKFDPARFPDRATLPTGPNTILGTLAYMSPEQVLGSRQLDARSDVYALGLMAYKAITGFHPAQRSRGGWMPQDLGQWGGWHVNNAPKPLPLVMSWLHERVWKVVAKALAKDPSERYRSAAEFSNELLGLLAWLKSNDLLTPPAPQLKATGAAAAALATTEQDITVTRSQVELINVGKAKAESTISAPFLSKIRTESAEAKRPAASLSTPIPVDSARGVPSTANGTEIIRRAPASSPVSVAPRTAHGTEIITLAKAAPMPLSTSISQSTPIAHAVPIVAPDGSRIGPRRLAIFGGAGVAIGICLAGLTALLARAPHKSSTPEAGGTLTAASTNIDAPSTQTTNNPSPTVPSTASSAPPVTETPNQRTATTQEAPAPAASTGVAISPAAPKGSAGSVAIPMVAPSTPKPAKPLTPKPGRKKTTDRVED